MAARLIANRHNANWVALCMAICCSNRIACRWLSRALARDACGMQACTWTGTADCDARDCTNKCTANLYPSFVATPLLSGIGYQNDAFYQICPELALAVTRVASGFYIDGPSTPAVSASGRKLLGKQHVLSSQQSNRMLLQSAGSSADQVSSSNSTDIGVVCSCN